MEKILPLRVTAAVPLGVWCSVRRVVRRNQRSLAEGKSNSESAAIEYQHLQMRQLLLFSLSSQKNYKFIYSFFGGLQLLFPLASDRWFHRTSAATGLIVRSNMLYVFFKAVFHFSGISKLYFSKRYSTTGLIIRMPLAFTK